MSESVLASWSPSRESNETLQEIQKRGGTLNFAKGITCDARAKVDKVWVDSWSSNVRDRLHDYATNWVSSRNTVCVVLQIPNLPKGRRCKRGSESWRQPCLKEDLICLWLCWDNVNRGRCKGTSIYDVCTRGGMDQKKMKWGILGEFIPVDLNH